MMYKVIRREYVDDLKIIGSGAYGVCYLDNDSTLYKIMYNTNKKTISDIFKIAKCCAKLSLNNIGYPIRPVRLAKAEEYGLKKLGYTSRYIPGIELNRIFSADDNVRTIFFENFERMYEQLLETAYTLGINGIKLNDINRENIIFDYADDVEPSLNLIDIDAWKLNREGKETVCHNINCIHMTFMNFIRRNNTCHSFKEAEQATYIEIINNAYNNMVEKNNAKTK